MAVIGKIRSKSGWLIAVIGIAMLAFILGDLFGNKGGQGPVQNKIGAINGQDISISEFEESVNAEVKRLVSQGEQVPTDANRAKVREQVWEQTVNRKALLEQIELAGVTVTSAELWELEQGAEPHPYIKQYFTNPTTGQFDRERFISYRKSLDTDENNADKDNWNSIEKQIQQERYQQKYLNLINKGLYVTEFEANQEAAYQSKTVDFKYVLKRYASIADTDVEVSESDIEEAYEKNKELYKQDASRGIEYVVFEVVPSKEDTTELIKWFENLKPEFEKTEDINWFVNGESDKKYIDKYLSKDDLSENLTSLFDAEPGSVKEVYLESGSFKMARLVETAQRADSVKARHILISSKGSADANKTLIDSLKQAIETGSNFAELAKTFSEDKGSGAEGGDLGWFKEGQMVPSFNDACFNGKEGDLTIVESKFGTHLINIQKIGPKYKKVKIAVIEREITPSDATYENIYAAASKFAANARTEDDFDNSITQQNLAKRIADNLKETQSNIAGIENARNLVKWAFKATEGQVSSVQEFGNKFVIAKLNKVIEEGYASIAERKFELELEAKKTKKAEKLVEQFNSVSASSIDAIATEVNETVQTVNGATFSGYSVPGLGREFDVQGTLFALQKGQVSAPIKGQQGVYILEVINITEASSNNLASVKQQLSSQVANRGTYEGITAIKEAAEIDDNRAAIY